MVKVVMCQAEQIKEQLSKTHKITTFQQVLGCSQPKIPKQTKSILLISDGEFHAISLAYETKLPVYVYNNFMLKKISEKQVNKLKTKYKSAYLKYLHSDKVGILVSTKHGQQNLNRALKFKKTCKKKTYLYIGNNIDKSEFENFPQIQSWVNTACPRMDFDYSVINIGKLNLRH